MSLFNYLALLLIFPQATIYIHISIKNRGDFMSNNNTTFTSNDSFDIEKFSEFLYKSILQYFQDHPIKHLSSQSSDLKDLCK